MYIMIVNINIKKGELYTLIKMNYIIIVDKHIKQMYICPSYIRRGQIMSNQKLNGSVTILAKAFHVLML